jgi:hypothetical protein
VFEFTLTPNLNLPLNQSYYLLIQLPSGSVGAQANGLTWIETPTTILLLDSALPCISMSATPIPLNSLHQTGDACTSEPPFEVTPGGKLYVEGWNWITGDQNPSDPDAMVTLQSNPQAFCSPGTTASAVAGGCPTASTVSFPVPPSSASSITGTFHNTVDIPQQFTSPASISAYLGTQGPGESWLTFGLSGDQFGPVSVSAGSVTGESPCIAVDNNTRRCGTANTQATGVSVSSSLTVSGANWPTGDNVSVYLLSKSSSCGAEVVDRVSLAHTSTVVRRDGSFQTQLSHLTVRANKEYLICVVDRSNRSVLSEEEVITFLAPTPLSSTFVSFTLLSGALAILALILYLVTSRRRRAPAYA